jgi:hypothetical protein
MRTIVFKRRSGQGITKEFVMLLKSVKNGEMTGWLFVSDPPLLRCEATVESILSLPVLKLTEVRKIYDCFVGILSFVDIITTNM